MSKANRKADMWEQVRAEHCAGASIEAIAETYGVSGRTIYRIISRPHGSTPDYHQAGEVDEEVKRFVCRWKDDHPAGTTQECADAISSILEIPVPPLSIKGMWQDCTDMDVGFAVRSMAMAYATLDELAALCGSDDQRIADQAYDRLRREMHPYIAGLFAAVHDKGRLTKQARRFQRIIGRGFPKNYDIRADVCQQIEISFWRLCSTYKITRGSKFFSYVNTWLPYKVREALRSTFRWYEHTVCMSEWQMDSHLSGDDPRSDIS